MKDTLLYSQILGIQRLWRVASVNVSLADDEVEVLVQHGGGKLRCPMCGQVYPGCDKRLRCWRHLDTLQLKTLLVADIPQSGMKEAWSRHRRGALGGARQWLYGLV